MIAESNGTFAHIGESTVPVIAWSGDGDALVAGESGSLQVASSVPGFRCLDTVIDGENSPVAIIPGGGWVARYPDGSTSPVIAWGVTRSGQLKPFGPIDDVAQVSGAWGAPTFEAVHPDETGPTVT